MQSVPPWLKSAVILVIFLYQAPVTGPAREASAQSEAKAADVKGNKTESLVLFLSVHDPTDEVKLALEALGLPTRRQAAARGVFAAAVAEAKQGEPKTSGEVSATKSPEGYSVLHGGGGELRLAARTQHGLANGLYDVRRALLLKGARLQRPCELLEQGDHAPHFVQRAFYHFMTTWGLERLSCDTLTAEQWRIHLGRMRSLNANQFYFDIWADQYYHPDYPQTWANKATYDRMRAACDYAHKLGLRTGVYFFPCQVPPSVYLANPKARAVEAVNYHGINMCPTRAWVRVIVFDTFLLKYFGPSLDDVVVEMQDPGSCLCEACCKQFPELILRFIKTYREVPGGPSDRRIDVCTLHYRDWLESPEINSRVAMPIKDLRKRVFEMLPKGTTLSDIDDPTMDMGREYGLKSNYFFFDLDPESGIENCQVFPRVKLRRIDSQIADSAARGHDGLTAYRMMPFAQHVADYALFRKCWNPKIDLDTAMTELAAEWNVPLDARPKFVEAMRNLDAWWEDHDFKALAAADTALQKLAADKQCSEFLIDLKDLVLVLAVLGEYHKDHPNEVGRADFFPPPEHCSSYATAWYFVPILRHKVDREIRR